MNWVESDMLLAYRGEKIPYLPRFHQWEVSLEEETGDPQASLRNLAKIDAKKLRVLQILVKFDRALVCYVSGHQYLALGLGLEHYQELADFASRHGFGSKDDLLDFYKSLPPGYDAPLPEDHPRPASGEIKID